MKHKIRKEKKREQRIGLAVTVAILITIISVSSFLIHSMLTSPQKQETSSISEPKAAIVDHLSLTAPNQTFTQTATNILKQAGYTVDYYLGEKVTVEFYRNLPTHGYGLIVLRVHSGIGERPPLALFTSENYSKTEYVYEQLTDQVGPAAFRPYHEGDPLYFGITPFFVRNSMNGGFQNTIIIMMGCDGLINAEMAKAFLDRGAKVYIGWNGPVLASHTDQTTIHLLQHLIIKKQTIDKALEETFLEIGPDPVAETILIYYPLEAGDSTIQNIIGSITTNTREIIITQDVFENRKYYEIH